MFILAAASLLSLSCARPDTQDSFMRADKARDGVYAYEFELTDSLSTYDFWIYGRSEQLSLYSLELRVLWTSPSGDTFRETVYMKELLSEGSRELYRSGMQPSEYGVWKVNIRPVLEDRKILGLGMICKSNLDGTR